MRQLEARRRMRELMEAQAVAREWADVLRLVRAVPLAVPAGVRARLPRLAPEDVAVLDDELRAVLTALADENAPGTR